MEIVDTKELTITILEPFFKLSLKIFLLSGLYYHFTHLCANRMEKSQMNIITTES